MISKPRIQAIAAAAALALASVALAQGAPGECGYGAGAYGGGPGMMGGWGGPGMMGEGWAPGPGAMGGRYGDRLGAGPSYVMGYRMGSGMGAYAFEGLDLTADQRAKLRAIQQGARTRQWGLMSRMMEARYNLEDLYDADVLDKAAINAQYKDIDDARRQMIDSSIDAHNQIRDVLTMEQREKIGRAGFGRGGPMMR